MKRNTISSILDRKQYMIIDGSMSTALENMGAKLNTALWTAAALARTPELVKQVHINYFRAGADCGITCSYQATIQGLTAHGYTTEQAEEILVNSVRVFLEARDEWWKNEGEISGRPYPLCLAGIGPYGAYLADGSEYRGMYGISKDKLRDFHERRMKLLWDAGADVLLFETQPSLTEAVLLADMAEEMGADYWISFSCKDDKHINEGAEIAECAAKLSEGHPHLKMIGVNCTKPEYIAGLITELKANTRLPVAVYPNSGEEYDPVTKTWHGSASAKNFEEYALDYFRAGATAVGGCCTTVEKHIMQVVSALETFMQES